MQGSAAGAVDLESARHAHLHTSGIDRPQTVFELVHHHRIVDLDAIAVVPPQHRVDLPRRAHETDHQVHQVTGHFKIDPAVIDAELRGQLRVPLPGLGNVAAILENLTQSSAPGKAENFVDRRIIAPHIGHLQHQALFPGQLVYAFQLRQIDAGRLLQQDVFAGPQGLFDVVQILVDMAFHDEGLGGTLQKGLGGGKNVQRQIVFGPALPIARHDLRVGIVHTDQLELVRPPGGLAHMHGGVAVPGAQIGKFKGHLRSPLVRADTRTPARAHCSPN